MSATVGRDLSVFGSDNLLTLPLDFLIGFLFNKAWSTAKSRIAQSSTWALVIRTFEVYAEFPTAESVTHLSVLARYVTALSFGVLKELRNREVFNSFAEFNGASKEFEDIESRVLTLARIAVKNNLEKWNVANPRLNMPQDIPTWELLLKNVISDYDFESDL